MTKEDIKTIIELFISWNGENEPIDISNLDHAIEYINDCIKSSSPSNLDEAARKAAVAPFNFELDEEHLYEYPYLPIAEQKFKEGAEWMAGQGETAIVKVDVNGMNTPIVYLWGDKWKKYSGDEVVVQIRKK